MIILGIDPSLNATGYGVIEVIGSKLYYVTSGIVKHEKTDSTSKKLLNISHVINDVILECKPHRSGVEETFVNSNAKTSLKLGMVRGVIFVSLERNSIPIFEISPNLAKKAITGYGKADKKQISFMVSHILSNVPKGKIFETEDETDALGIAIATFSFSSNKLS